MKQQPSWEGGVMNPPDYPTTWAELVPHLLFMSWALVPLAAYILYATFEFAGWLGPKLRTPRFGQVLRMLFAAGGSPWASLVVAIGCITWLLWSFGDAIEREKGIRWRVIPYEVRTEWIGRRSEMTLYYAFLSCSFSMQEAGRKFAQALEADDNPVVTKKKRARVPWVSYEP